MFRINKTILNNEELLLMNLCLDVFLYAQSS